MQRQDGAAANLSLSLPATWGDHRMPRFSSTLVSACVWALGLLLLTSLGAQAAINRIAWGGKGGKGVDLYVLTNAGGMEVRISNYGGDLT